MYLSASKTATENRQNQKNDEKLLTKNENEEKKKTENVVEQLPVFIKACRHFYPNTHTHTHCFALLHLFKPSVATIVGHEKLQKQQ